MECSVMLDKKTREFSIVFQTIDDLLNFISRFINDIIEKHPDDKARIINFIKDDLGLDDGMISDILDFSEGIKVINDTLEYAEDIYSLTLEEIQFINIHLLNTFRGDNKTEAIKYFNEFAKNSSSEGINEEVLSMLSDTAYAKLKRLLGTDIKLLIKFPPKKIDTDNLSFVKMDKISIKLLKNPTEELLDDQDRAGLKVLCAFNGLDTTGTYTELYERLLK